MATDFSNLDTRARKALATGTHEFTETDGVQVVLAGTAPRTNGTEKLEAAIASRGARYIRTLLVTFNVVAVENLDAYRAAKAKGDNEAMLQCLLKSQIVITDENAATVPSFQIGQAVRSITVLPSKDKEGNPVVGSRGALAGQALYRASQARVYQPVSIDLFDEDEVETVASVDLEA